MSFQNVRSENTTDIEEFIFALVARSQAKYVIRLLPQPESSRVTVSVRAAPEAQMPEGGRETIHELTLHPDSTSGFASIGSEVIADAVVLCLDGLENSAAPGALGRHLAFLQEHCRLMVLCTPDRARTMGLTRAVRAQGTSRAPRWSAEEFGRFLIECGFPGNFLIGYARSRKHHTKDAAVVVAGRDARAEPPERNVRVAAIMNVFNEADILEETVLHLSAHGIEVHIFDDWSSDGSYEIAQRLVGMGHCKGLSRAGETPSTEYNWTNLLKRVEQYARTLDTDWVIHYDADEIRCSPWPELSLLEAISRVDALGYNAVDFSVLNFLYTEQNAAASMTELGRFRYFDFGRQTADFIQVKAWRSDSGEVDLASSGGHDARFEGRRLFPLKFLTKHYPLRSQWQAEAKLFSYRIPRIARERSEKGWHVHYDGYETAGTVRPWRATELTPYDARSFHEEFLLERLAGVGVEVVNQVVPSAQTILAMLEASRSRQSMPPGAAPASQAPAVELHGLPLQACSANLYAAPVGFYEDRWVAPYFHAIFVAVNDLSKGAVELWLKPVSTDAPQVSVALGLDGTVVRTVNLEPGKLESIEFPVAAAKGRLLHLELRTQHVSRAAANDARMVSYKMHSVKFS